MEQIVWKGPQTGNPAITQLQSYSAHSSSWGLNSKGRTSWSEALFMNDPGWWECQFNGWTRLLKVLSIPTYRALLCGDKGLAGLHQEPQPEIHQLLFGCPCIWSRLEVTVDGICLLDGIQVPGVGGEGRRERETEMHSSIAHLGRSTGFHFSGAKLHILCPFVLNLQCKKICSHHLLFIKTPLPSRTCSWGSHLIAAGPRATVSGQFHTIIGIITYPVKFCKKCGWLATAEQLTPSIQQSWTLPRDSDPGNGSPM